MSTIKRPARGDTEDDLLKFQKEFLSKQNNKSENSASLVNIDSIKVGDKRKPISNDSDQLLKESPDSASHPTKVRTFEETKPKTKHAVEKEPLYEVPDCDVLNDKSPNVSLFLTQIVERDTKNFNVSLPTYSEVPFPSVFKRDVNIKKDTSNKKLSLFARQLEKQQKLSDVEMVSPDEEVLPTYRQRGIRSSTVLKGTGLSVSFAENEVKKIHEENAAKLAELTESEIFEEQKRLFESIDPKILSFLKHKDRNSDNALADVSRHDKKQKKDQKKTSPDITLPLKREEDWVGMDNIEYDKLEWMKDVPPIQTTADTIQGKQARFDLDGHFLSADASVPVHQGLHHHGDEPERAGYTLEELFHLSRSSNIPQRILALNVLAKILQKAKQGLYSENIQTAILPTVLEAGVIFLFRWALDDISQSVQIAAVNTLYSLLCSDIEQTAVDRIAYWYQGLVQPCLLGQDKEDSNDEGEDEVEDETDDVMAKRDLVEALISRMMILPRLKYLLQEKCLSAPAIVQILTILTRLAQHSPSSAYKIVHCPGLLMYIFQEFLPATWTPVECDSHMTFVRGYPVPEALKLVTAICKAGRNMTSILLSTYNLQDIVQRYIAVLPGDLQLPVPTSNKLRQQSYIAWKICLHYGFMDELFLNLYSVIIENIKSIHQNVINNKENDNYLLISALESVINVTGIHIKQTPFNTLEEAMEIEDNKYEPLVNWSNITGLHPLLIQSYTHQLSYIGNNYHYQKKSNLEMATCLTNVVASYFDKYESQVNYNAVESLQSIETICTETIEPFWKSLGFRSMLINISKYSNLLSSVNKNEESCISLPDYGASCLINGTSLPILQSSSPFGFLTALLRLVIVLCRLHKEMIDQLVPMIVDDKEIISYIRKICQTKGSDLYSNYFTKFENIFQYQILKLSSLKDNKEMTLLHHTSLVLLTRLQYGDEYLIHDLLSHVIFSPQYLSESRSCDESLQSMADLQITDTQKLMSATQEEITLVKHQLLETCRNDLLSGTIRSVYMTVFSGKEKQCNQSRSRYLYKPQVIDSLMTGKTGNNLLPQDWMFLPLVELYNKSFVAGSYFQDHMPVENIRMISNVLKWIYLLECERPDILKLISTSVKISRVLCVFLAGNSLFLENSIRNYLAALLREYTKPTLLQHLDFTVGIPGLVSFFDLFKSLLEQYEAVSYGDSVFGSYILIPLLQRHSVSYRVTLWSEHQDVLKTLIISIKELLLPIEEFLQPDETDTELIQLYCTRLMSQVIQPIRTPVPYLIAIHHTNRFLYYTQDSETLPIRDKMWSWVKAVKNEILKNHLIHYKKFSRDSEYCLELYTTLPSNRQQTFNHYIV